MKILFNVVDLKYNSGGISRLSFLTYTFLKKKFNKITVLEFGNSNDFIKKKISCFNIKILFFFINLFLQWKYSYKKIIYTHVGLSRAHFLKTNYILFLYGLDAWSKKSLRTINIIKNAEKIIFCSYYSKNRSEKELGIKYKNYEVIYPGTFQNYPPVFSKKKNKKKIQLIITGRLVNDLKGHYFLFDALVKIKKKIPDFVLHVVGQGPEISNMKSYVRKNNLNSNAIFHGFINKQKLNDLMLTADIFVMPSQTEGFGLVYIEAMRYKLPIIASIHDAGAEVNINNFTGFNVNLYKKKDLELKLERLIKNSKLRKKFGKNSFNLWKQKFKKKNFYERLSKIF